MIEECYELLDIDEEDTDHMIEELGDVMLQVMLHAQIGEDEGYFSIDDVIRDISAKMVRRHPHVFKDVKVQDEHDVVANWEEIKRRKSKQHPLHCWMPCRKHCLLLRKPPSFRKSRKTGFDWDNVQDIWDKVNEELKEFSAEASAESADEISLKAEFGDVLFALVNIDTIKLSLRKRSP